MHNSQLNKAGHWLSVVIISMVVLISFRAFALHLSPEIQINQAVHVLMAYDLQLPDDLYYWGQDRLGSFGPILTHLILQVVPISPIKATSYLQHGLLIIGLLCFASLLKYPVSRIILALVVFLPGYYLTFLSVGQPYTSQFALIGIAVVVVDRLFNQWTVLKGWQRHSLIAIATASLMIAYWVSTFTIITIALVLIMIAASPVMLFLNGSAASRRQLLQSNFLVILNIVVVGGLGFAFTNYAQENAVRHQNYAAFNTAKQVLEVLAILVDRFIRTVTFQSGNIILSLHAFASIILGAYLIYLSANTLAKNKGFLNVTPSRWAYFSLANAFIGFGILLMANWVYENKVDFRYFSLPYVMGMVAMLLFAEALVQPKSAIVVTLLLIIALTLSFSLPGYVFSWQRPVSRLSQLKEFEALGAIGIIGERFQAYIPCAANPALLSCVTHDKVRRGKARCAQCLERVLAADTIYLIQDDWLDSFPDSIDFIGNSTKNVGAKVLSEALRF